MQIALRNEAFYAWLKAENISRDEGARRIGVNRATAYRIDEKQVAPSAKFIAGLMIATGRKFEDLFEIVKDAA